MKAERFLKKTWALVLFFLLLTACQEGNKEQLPVDFAWGRVACLWCKMTISDPHYAAQVIDPRGRTYHFDDIGCTILWLRRQPWKDNARTWVNDVKTTEWIEAEKANWIYGDPKTPMGYGFAATLSPVENALEYKIVKKRMIIGNTLVNEKPSKPPGISNKQPGVDKQPVFSTDEKNESQIP